VAINLRRIYAVWLREVKRFTNSKARMVGSLAQPLLFLIVLGGGLSALIPGFNYAAYILPGIVMMTILFSSISSGVSIIWDREFGFLKEMLASPTSRANLVLGRTFGGATIAVLQGLLIFLVGLLITGTAVPPLLSLVAAFFLMVLISCFLVAVGICIASLVQEVETFQLIMNLVVMPLFFHSNALFPVSKMPGWLQTAIMFNPVSYAVDGLRGLIIGQSSFGVPFDVGVSCVFFVVAILVATYLFSKTSV